MIALAFENALMLASELTEVVDMLCFQLDINRRSIMYKQQDLYICSCSVVSWELSTAKELTSSATLMFNTSPPLKTNAKIKTGGQRCNDHVS